MRNNSPSGLRSVLTKIALPLMAIGSLWAASNTNALERVRIDSNNNVVSDRNSPLRGAPFFLDRFGIAAETGGMEANLTTYRNYFNSVVRDYKLNMVRCSPWIGKHTYFTFGSNQADHEDKFDILLDNCVQWAEDNDIYAIVNYHTEFDTVLNADYVKRFWDRYAPRFRNKKHVMFELVNEPNVESVKREMQGIYDHVRNLAPSTHMILWSLYDPTKITAQEIKDSTPTIDYQNDNVSVGWHNYLDLGNPGTWDRADDFAANGLPIINTEFWSLSSQNDLPISYGSIADNVRFGESRGRSWTLWAPYFHYEDSNKNYSHDELKFSSTFVDAVRNGGFTIGNPEFWSNGDYAAGLNGEYWTKWGPSIGYNGSAGTISNDSSGGSSNSSGTTTNTIGFAQAPSNVNLSGNFTVSASYSASGNRDLVLEVFNQNTGVWLGEAKAQVTRGTGTQNITARVGAIPAGTYRLKLSIRDRKASWQSYYQQVFRDNVQAGGSSNNNNAGTKPTINLNASFADQVSNGVQRYDGWGVGNYGPGAWVKFNRVDLGVKGYDRIRVQLATNGSGQIEVRAQSLTGPVLATVNYSGNDYSKFIWRESSFPAWEYPQTLYFVVKSGWANMGGIQLIDD